MTTPETIYDRKDQLQQVQSALLPGERLYAVYDAKGVGTGYIALTDRRVIIADKSFIGRAVALVSMPYRSVSSVAVVSNARFTGNFFSTCSIIVTSAGGVHHEIEFRGEDKARHAHDFILASMLQVR
jgi:Bacterial PH domain